MCKDYFLCRCRPDGHLLSVLFSWDGAKVAFGWGLGWDGRDLCCERIFQSEGYKVTLCASARGASSSERSAFVK